MKHPALFLAAAVVAFSLANVAHSQLAGASAQTPLQRLESIKTKNKHLIEKQTETLKMLEELDLHSQQIKFLGKRA